MSQRILVVEDESGIRQLIRDALDGHDYQMMMCNNAMTAKAALAKQTPDPIERRNCQSANHHADRSQQ